ncbi:MAG: RCC1 domain-containing protein, partial [Planctomycetota bacterium]
MAQHTPKIAAETHTLGGGIYNLGATPTIVNCTFSGNQGGPAGGALLNQYGSSPIITNCILWDNGPKEVYNSFSDPIFRYCDIEDSNGSGSNWYSPFGIDGGGNIDADPCFVNDANVIGDDANWATIDDGQLGDDQTETARHEPVRVAAGEQSSGNYLEDIVEIAAGRSGTYSMARDATTNRYLWTWGANYWGQLGNNSTQDANTPVQVKTGASTYLSDVIDLDAGMQHSIALQSDGDVYCWGRNTHGQVGNGKSEPDYDPDPAREPNAVHVSNLTA